MSEDNPTAAKVDRDSGPIDLDSVRIDPAWALRVPASIALRRLALPLCAVDGRLVVAMADPGDSAAAEAVSRAAGMPVEPRAADRERLRAWLLPPAGLRRTPSRPTRWR